MEIRIKYLYNNDITHQIMYAATVFVNEDILWFVLKTIVTQTVKI